MERLRGYKKQVVSLLMAVVVLATGILATSFQSFASSFSVPFQEPSTELGQGYILLELQNNVSGARVLNMFAWSVGCFDDTGSNQADFDSLSVGIYLTDSVIELRFEVEDLITPFDVVVGYYNGSGKTRVVKSEALTTHTSYSMNYANDGDGYKIVGYQFKGSVTTFNESNSLYNFDVPQITWGSETSLMNVMLDIVRDLNNLKVTIENEISDLGDSISGDIGDLNTSMVAKIDELLARLLSMHYDIDFIEEYLTEIRNYLEVYLPAIDYELDCIDEELDRIYAKIDALLEEQKKSNTWLGKIWDSIQEFINPKSSDKSSTDGFKSDSDGQSGEINDLNEQGKTEKVDIDSASGNVDAYIDGNAIRNYGTLLSVFTNHEYILQCILVVLAIGLVAYVLFGKKR